MLRNGLDNAGGNFFCYEAICFPQIETFLFLHKEYMKLLKGSLWNIMYYNPLWKGISLCLKILTNHKSWRQKRRKVYVLWNSHKISLLFGVRQDFVIRKSYGKLRINLDVALWGFQTKCCLNQSGDCVVQTIVRSCHSYFPSYLDHTCLTLNFNDLLTTKLHFHCQAYENGNTSVRHTLHQNLYHNLGPTKDGSLLLGPHWGPWTLLTCDPAHGSLCPPYKVKWWHMVQ